MDGLALRCGKQPDSINGFVAAAAERYVDGERLAQTERKTAAIYLWGYAAEMTLKAAYFRFMGHNLTQHITIPEMKAARSTAIAAKIAWPTNNLHYLLGWAEALAERRTATAAAYPAAFSLTLTGHVGRLQLLWNETLRYHSNRAYAFEVKRARDAITWLRNNSISL